MDKRKKHALFLFSKLPYLKLPVLIVQKHSLMVGRVADVVLGADTAVASVAVAVVAPVAFVADAVSVADDVAEAAVADDVTEAA